MVSDGAVRAEVRPECPRCGYDLSGQVMQWQVEPPSQTRCAECGLDEVLTLIERSRLRVPTWSFEHAMHGRTRSLFRTLLRSLRPWRFWREVPIEAPIRPWRIVQFAAAAVVLPALAYLVLVAVEAACQFAMQRPKTLGTGSIRLITQWRSSVIDPSVARAGLSVLLYPITLFCLPQTFRKVRIRTLQVLRVAAYSIAAPIAFYWLLLWLSTSVAFTFGRVTYVIVEIVPISFGMTMFSVVWIWLYWWQAADSYLRLPTPMLVTLLHGTIAFLAATALVFWVGGAWSPEWLGDWSKSILRTT